MSLFFCHPSLHYLLETHQHMTIWLTWLENAEMWLKTNLLKVIKLAESVTFPLDQSRRSEQQCQRPCQWQSTEMWQVRKWALWGAGDRSTAVPTQPFVDPPLGLHWAEPRAERYRKGHIISKEGKLWMSMQTEMKAVSVGNNTFPQPSQNSTYSRQNKVPWGSYSL